jgi:hypothetical protein
MLQKLGQPDKATEELLIQAHKVQQIENLPKLSTRRKRVKGKRTPKEVMRVAEVDGGSTQIEDVIGVQKEPTKAERAKQVRLKLSSSIPSEHIF